MCQLEGVGAFFYEFKRPDMLFYRTSDNRKRKEKAIFDKTREVVVSLIEKGVRFFGVGGAIGYDTIAAHVILSLKEKYPYIKLILVLPCKDQTHGWYDSDVKKYNNILSRADKVVYTAERYYDGCMLKRNRYLVDNSGYCICYQKRNIGGTAYTVNYAKQKELIIYKIEN